MLPIAARILTFVTALSISGEAASQGSSGPTLDPAQLSNDFETARRQQERRAGSNIRMPEPIRAVSQPVSRQSTTPLFRLKAITVEGARAIPGERIALTYASFLGKNVSPADFEEIARLISDLYRAEGYHLSRAIVPPQDIKGGALRVRVIEGRIVDVAVEGDGAARAERVLHAVRDEEPARLSTLERYLLLVNDTPGHKVAETQIEEIGVASGKFRLIVRLETWRAFSFLGVDNFGVPAVGPLLAQYSTALNSAFMAGDAIGLNVSTVPDSPRELSFGQLWYEAPLGTDGMRFGLSVGYGEIHPSDDRHSRGTITTSEIYEARITMVPLRTRRSSLWFTASATVQNVSETEATGTIYDDRLRTIGVRADHQAQDRWGGWNYLTLGVRQGLDVFDASPRGSALLSRTDGSADFTRIEFSLTRIQRLSEAWSVRFSSAGQWASRPLLGSQEFNLGGRIFGLGFDTGLIGGDHGVGAVLELRYDRKLPASYLRGYQVFSFLDGGTAINILPGRDWIGSISSAGFGARFYFPDDVLAEFGVAFPLSHPAAIEIGHGPRVFFLVSKVVKTCPAPNWRCS